MKESNNKVLTRALGLPECITITAGAVIGVGGSLVAIRKFLQV